MMNALKAIRSLASANDSDLAAQIRQGNAGAFEVVFHAHYEGVRAFVAGYVKDDAVAEEVVQDLFFRIWETRDTFAEGGSVKAYLYRAARNRALVRMRRGRIEREWTCELAHRGPALAEPADYDARRHDVAAAVSQAIDALPPKCRTVFLLSRGHGLTAAEIAQALGIAPKTVEQQLWRALKALRARLTAL